MHSIINKIKKQTGSSLGSNRTPSDGPTSSLKRIRCVCSTDICHMGYGTYPRATRLQDGSLLGTHTAFYNSENIIVTTKSTDDGMSWNPFGEVGCISCWIPLPIWNTIREPSSKDEGHLARHPSERRIDAEDKESSWLISQVTRGVGDIDNPFLIQLQNGNVLCAFRNHSKNLDGSYLHHRITVCVSEDGGKAWKYLSTPEEVISFHLLQRSQTNFIRAPNPSKVFGSLSWELAKMDFSSSTTPEKMPAMTKTPFNESLATVVLPGAKQSLSPVMVS